MKLFESEYYEFTQWKDAFSKYYELEKQFPNKVQLVISSHFCTSGYWVEPLNTTITPLDERYSGISVNQLEDRVRKEIEKAAKQGRLPHLTF